jgi:hypothetical protein
MGKWGDGVMDDWKDGINQKFLRGGPKEGR